MSRLKSARVCVSVSVCLCRVESRPQPRSRSRSRPSERPYLREASSFVRPTRQRLIVVELVDWSGARKAKRRREAEDEEEEEAEDEEEEEAEETGGLDVGVEGRFPFCSAGDGGNLLISRRRLM